MESRRYFIKKCIAGSVTIMIPAWATAFGRNKSIPPLKTLSPQSALVLYYSQTGHTGRIARLIARIFEKKGLTADVGDYRNLQEINWERYDLILFGTPVHYMDVPVNITKWLKRMPRVHGTAVSSFVTYGGKGDGQYNTAAGLLKILTEKEGVPVGLGMFSNMSTFAPTWSTGNKKRILKYSHLPDEATFLSAKTFAEDILKTIAAGQTIQAEKTLDMAMILNKLPQIEVTKLMISDHRINEENCVGCGTCASICPVGAIDIEKKSIDAEKCIACIGCVNNCDYQAITMKFMGRPVYGFKKFLEREGIRIKEPDDIS